MIKRLLESFGAWRRGDRRVAPPGTVGRVFDRGDSAGRHNAPARGQVSMRKTIIRKAPDNG